MKHILKELTMLDESDLFATEFYPNNVFDYPLHFHEYYELCLTLNARGKRITGNVIENFSERDLVITMPGVPHCYKRDETSNKQFCQVVVIKFHAELVDSEIFNTHQLFPIKNMLKQQAPGLRFSDAAIDKVKNKIIILSSMTGFEAVNLFLEILNDLANSSPQKIAFNNESLNGITQSRRINKIIKYVEKNYGTKISLAEIGLQIGMSPSSVSRFFKNKTRLKFCDYLNGLRIEKASTMMTETERSISEICYACGFNNVSNFNRLFLVKTGLTPSSYRKKYKSSIV